MKRFYKKYILLGSILLASVFGAQGVMGQTTAPSGVRLASDAVAGNLVTASSKNYEVFYFHPSNTASLTTLAIKTWDGTTTTVGASTWCNIGGSVGNTSATTTAGTYGEYTITTSTRWARIRASNQANYQVVFNVEGYASVSAFYQTTATVLFDIKEWNGSAYVASGLTGTQTASGSYFIRTETLNSAKRYQITLYGTGSGTTNYNIKAFALEVPTVSCTTPTITYNVTATSNSICNGSSTTIGLSNTQTNVTYELLAGGSAIGGGVTMLGDGAAKTFAAQSPSATTTYTVRSTTATGGFCQTAINGGSPTSQVVTVTANPSISAHPSNTSASIGGAAATMSVTASSGSAYQWQYSADGSTGWASVANGTPANVSYTNATTATVSITAATGATPATAYYRCVVTATSPCVTDATSNVGNLTITSGASAPSVTSTTATSITSSGASSGGNVTSDGGSAITARGVVYGTSANPTIAGTKTTDAGTTGAYTSTITGLSASTLYYYRAYATNAIGTSYGAESSFTTSASGGSCAATIDLATGYVSSFNKTFNAGAADELVTVFTGDSTSTTACNSASAVKVARIDASAEYIQASVPVGSAATMNTASFKISANSTGTSDYYNVIFCCPSETFSTTNITDTLQVHFTGYNQACILRTVTFPANIKSWRMYRSASYTAGSPGSIGSGTSVGSGQTNRLTYMQVCLNTVAGTPPTVTTQAVSSIGATSAVGNGNVTALGDGVSQHGVCWKTSTGPTTADSKTQEGIKAATGAYTTNMTLTANTLYYVKAYASGSGGTGYGAEVTVTTLPAAPTVAAESSVTSNSFVANWTAPTQGGVSFTYTVEVDESGGDYSSLVASYTLIASGTLSQAVSGLSSSTAYQYRVKCVNSQGSGAWSGNETVTTTAPAPEINITQAGTTYLDATSTYAFGEVMNTTNSDITFTIQNTGAGTLTITTASCTVTGTGFSMQTAPGASVAAGGTGTFVVRFTPTTSGAYTGLITIVSNDADEATYTINLTGTGTSSLTPPTGLASVTPTASGFTLNWNTVPTTDGYEVKVCQVNTSSTLIDITDIGAWAAYPSGSNCTKVEGFTIDHNTTTTQSTAYGTFTIANAAVGSGATCAYVQMGKTGQTAVNGNGAWDGNVDGNGGILTFPSVASAGTLTVYVSGTGSSSRTMLVEKSLDGGITWSTVGTITSVATTATAKTITVNEASTVILRLRTNVAQFLRVHSINLTSYVTCAAAVQVAGQATATYTYNTLTPNTEYFYSIRSYQTTGPVYSNWTAISSATNEITLPNPPTVSAATSVTSTGMTLNWAAPAVAGNQTYTYTIEYANNAGYTGSTSLTGISSTTLTQALTGLSANTTYYYRVRCENASGYSTWSSGSQLTTTSLPSVTTTTASAVATTTASSGGDVTNDGGAAVTARGVAYGTSAAPTVAGTKTTDASGTGVFTSSITGLTPNTTYYYRAYATSTAGTGYGTESSFLTLPNAPTVGTGSAATMSGFTANWTAPGTPGAATYTYTIEVTSTTGDYSSPAVTLTGIASGTLSTAITGLNSFVTYYYRVKCVNAAGSSAWSAESVGYQTLAGGATVSTTTATSITTTGASTGGNATSDGGAAISVKGMVYKTSSPVTTTDNPTGGGGAGTGVFTTSLSGLTANTKYYYRAYATNANGTSLGSELNFTTLPEAPTVGTGSAATSTGFTANWTAPTQGAETFTYDVDVTATSGDFSVLAATYSGITSTNLSKLITGLSPTTTYYYRVRAVNTSGESAWSAQSAGITTLAQKTLTVTFSPLAGGTVTGDGISLSSGVAQNYTINEDVTLVATPASGYGFLRWVVNGTTQVTNNPYDLTLADNTTVTAVFGTSSCSTANFDALTSTDLSTGSDVSVSFTESGATWSTITCRLNTTSSLSHSGNNSIRMPYSNGAVITKAVARPTSISFWARMSSTSVTGTLKVYMSTDGGTNYDATAILTANVPTAGAWQQFTTSVSTTSSNVKFKIVNETGNGSTSYNAYLDDVQICEGPDAAPPTITFSPANGATSVLMTTNGVITSNEALYIYDPVGGTYTAINGSTTDAALKAVVSLVRNSDNQLIDFTASASADGKTITINPNEADAPDYYTYATAYKLSIVNVADASQNTLPASQSAIYTTRPVPNPEIKVELVSTNVNINSGGSANMGTLISTDYVEKQFRIINTAVLDALNISSCTFTSGGAQYSVTVAPAASVAADDTTTFTVRFNPPGGTTTVYNGVLRIVNNDNDEVNFDINFSGGEAAFVLPYKYESGLTSPTYSASALYHDYTGLGDIPAQIRRNGGTAMDADHFYSSYSVFQVEGNCMPSGSSALRVGQGANGLELNLPNCGTITVKWCSNGYRKIKISSGASVYEQSASFMPGQVCYTTSTVVNTPNAVVIDIELLGTDPALLGTVYYLEITPYDPAVQSSAKNITDFSTGVAGENVRIYDDVIFVSVPTGTNLTTITPSVITPSPFATVSPGAGVLRDFTTYKTYTVTAENGTTKTYKVYVEIAPSYPVGTYYEDSIAVTVPMLNTDRVLEVLEISNESCIVPTSGNGSSYTLHFLDATDNPGTYNIGGLTDVCIGSTATYSITNAPVTNNPSYTWKVSGNGAYLPYFAVANGTTTYKDGVGNVDTLLVAENLENLQITMPNDTLTANLTINIQVRFNPGCSYVNGTAALPIHITQDAPEPVNAIEAGCVSNGLLTLTALGSGASATTYGWTFSPSQTVVSQSDSSIVINVGSSAADITAEVVAQNGCGVTVAQAAYPVDYSTPATTWLGATSDDWNLASNWSGRVPTKCTDVTIPNVNTGTIQYPVIELADNAECRNILFESGGAVLGLQWLDYDKASVKLEVVKDHWYTLTPPLKEMYSGDYYFNGAPEAYMRLFNTTAPGSIGPNILYAGTFTRPFADLVTPLTPGLGFAFNVSQRTWDYPTTGTTPALVSANKTISFPRLNSDSSLLQTYIPYSSYNGRLYTFQTKTVTKDPDYVYRLAMEGADSTMTNKTVALTAGFNLIGNPMMTHLNISQFLNDNSAVIANYIKVWNGTTYQTYNGTTDTWDLGPNGDYLAPMQSFVVYSAAGGNVTFNLLTHFAKDDNLSALRNANIKANTLFIRATKAGITSGTVISNQANANNEYGNDDIYKLFTPETQVADVYTMASSYALAFNHFNKYPFTAPLAIKTSEFGKVKFDFTGAESFDNVDVYLINTLSGEQVNLKETSSYETEVTEENAQGSLFVEFRSASVVTDASNSSDNANDVQIITKENNTVRVISSSSNLIKEVIVMDEVGKVLIRHKGLAESTHDVTLNNGSKVVIVKAITEKGVKFSKVLIK